MKLGKKDLRNASKERLLEIGLQKKVLERRRMETVIGVIGTYGVYEWTLLATLCKPLNKIMPFA